MTPRYEYVQWQSRHFRKDLKMRVKSLAPIYDLSFEHMLNLVVEKGLEVVERESFRPEVIE